MVRKINMLYLFGCLIFLKFIFCDDVIKIEKPDSDRVKLTNINKEAVTRWW